MQVQGSSTVFVIVDMDERMGAQQLADTKQSITLVLQDIDRDLANANQIISERVLPAIKRYGEETARAAASTHFLEQLFKASEALLENDSETARRLSIVERGPAPFAPLPAAPTLERASPCPGSTFGNLDTHAQPESSRPLQVLPFSSQVTASTTSTQMFTLELPKLKTQFEL